MFFRQDTVESQLKVAEILQLLAEISMESDNNTAAINDLRECLQIQKKHLKPDDRILAETYPFSYLFQFIIHLEIFSFLILYI